MDSGAEFGTPEAVIPTAIKSGIKTETGSAASTTEPAIKSSDPAIGRPQTAVLNSETGSEVSSETEPSSPGERGDNGGAAMPGDVSLPGSFAATDEGFARIFDDALLAFVVGALPPTSAMAKLQGLARQAVPDPAKRPAFVEYGMKRLSSLTLGVTGPKSVTKSASTAVSKATLNALAKVLVDALGHFIPGGVNPATRTALIGVIGLLLMGLLPVVGATGWILTAGTAAVGTVLLAGWIAVHFVSPSQQRHGMQSTDS